MKLSVDVGLLVKREQALALIQSMVITIAANTFIALSLVAMLWGRMPRTYLVTWTAVILAINALRLLTVIVARRGKWQDSHPDRFLHLNWIGALAAGIVWGALLLAAFSYGAGLRPAVTFLCCGITAGAVIQGRTHAATVWAFILPIELTHLYCFFSFASFEGYVLSVNVLLYIGMLCRSALHAEKTFSANNRLKHEATELATSLRTANDVAAEAVTRLDHLANHDVLTGLSNRAAFNSVFNESLEEARRNLSEVTLLLVDLDRFKAINDTFGHAAGDRVLTEVARRVRRKLGPDDLFARLGGDEFAIIIKGHRTEASTVALATALVEAVSRPVLIGDRQLSIGASIGFSLYPRDGYSVEELQISADLALYAAKSGGRGLVRGFDENLRAATDARRVFELDLADALEKGSLEVWFQPQVGLSDRRLVGMESLIRWNHPNHGWVAPPEIVAAAAATRQSEALTAFVVDASCRMIRALTFAGYDDVEVSFNVSPKELGSYSLTELIARAIAAHGVEPDRLGVEITEETMFSEERGGADLQAISAMGVNIAVDDFGVGYSSFGALRSMKFDCIKIDRVFVERLTEAAGDRALVQAILGVARALGVKAIAEGVETAEQVAVLASLGCNEVQGYYFGRPMPAKKVLEWIVDRTAVKAYPAAVVSKAIEPPEAAFGAVAVGLTSAVMKSTA